MILNLNTYEAAIVNLALRQFATSQFQVAVNALQGKTKEDADEATERGKEASRIADLLG